MEFRSYPKQLVDDLLLVSRGNGHNCKLRGSRLCVSCGGYFLICAGKSKKKKRQKKGRKINALFAA